MLCGNTWPNLAVAVALEYESVLKRSCRRFGVTEDGIEGALDAIFSRAVLHRLYFLWRPVAADPNDDLAMKAAIGSNRDFAITFNKRNLLPALRARSRLGLFDQANQIGQASWIHIANRDHVEIAGAEAGHMKSCVLCQ